jgi:hypothetical protein
MTYTVQARTMPSRQVAQGIHLAARVTYDVVRPDGVVSHSRDDRTAALADADVATTLARLIAAALL